MRTITDDGKTWTILQVPTGCYELKAINAEINEDSKEMKFIEVVRDCYLHQHLEKPTRKRGNEEPSLIDLVLTDDVMQVTDIVYHAPLGKSDHNIISFNFNCYQDYSKPKEL